MHEISSGQEGADFDFTASKMDPKWDTKLNKKRTLGTPLRAQYD